jgi:chromosome segregation ATPase
MAGTGECMDLMGDAAELHVQNLQDQLNKAKKLVLVTHLSETRQRLASECEKVRAAIKATEERLKQVAQAQQFTHELDDARSELVQVNGRIIDVRGEITSLHRMALSQVNAAEQSLQHLNTQHEALRAEHKNLVAQREPSDSSSSLGAKQVNSAAVGSAEILALQQATRELNAELASVIAAREKAEAKTIQAIAEEKRLLDEMNKEGSRHEEMMQHCKKRCVARRQELEALCKERKQAIQAAQEAADGAWREADAWQTLHNHAEVEAKAAAGRVEKLQKQVKEAKQQLESMSSELRRTNESLVIAEAEGKRFAEEADRLKWLSLLTVMLSLLFLVMCKVFSPRKQELNEPKSSDGRAHKVVTEN